MGHRSGRVKSGYEDWQIRDGTDVRGRKNGQMAPASGKGKEHGEAA